ncbi:MAG: radical SAM protein [Candidatus Bathyarchaeota archaeon]|nr:radical SAM protein [Candidatus Bathyarchaeota archaeon]
MEKRSVCVVCNGCPENRVDAAKAETFLIQNGFRMVGDWHAADVVLFNCCGGHGQRVKQSFSIIREIQRNKNPNQRLIVWGCLPKIYPEIFKDEFVDVTVSEVEFPRLKELGVGGSGAAVGNYLVAPWKYDEKTAGWLLRYQGSFLSRGFKRVGVSWVNYVNNHFNLAPAGDASTFYIKTSSGCRGRCAYCVVPQARGTIKSKPIEQLRAEFQDGLTRGFKRFSLLGTDLGSYGADLGENLCSLLSELVEVEGKFRINLRNVHPRFMMDMMDEFAPILRTGKIRYIESPVESGSNRILKLMNRPYTVEEYKEYIAAMQKIYPNLIVRSQLIAGFPTETDEDFQKSLKLLDEVVLDYVEVYEYSEMPRTPSQKIEPKVPDAVKRQRFLTLNKKALLNRTPRKIKRIILSQT